LRDGGAAADVRDNVPRRKEDLMAKKSKKDKKDKKDKKSKKKK
jgi:hypothetical protein